MSLNNRGEVRFRCVGLRMVSLGHVLVIRMRKWLATRGIGPKIRPHIRRLLYVPLPGLMADRRALESRRLEILGIS